MWLIVLVLHPHIHDLRVAPWNKEWTVGHLALFLELFVSCSTSDLWMRGPHIPDVFALQTDVFFLSQIQFSCIVECNPKSKWEVLDESFLHKAGLSFLACDAAILMWLAKISFMNHATCLYKMTLASSSFFYLKLEKVVFKCFISFQVAGSCKICFWTATSSFESFDIVFLFLQEASSAIPLFSPVIVPMAQSFGPILSQLTSYPTIRFGVWFVYVNYWLWCQNYWFKYLTCYTQVTFYV